MDASRSTTTFDLLATTPLRIVVWGGYAGLAWNIFGVVKFVESLMSTPESLMAMGMTSEQAAIYAGYPAWMTAAFAVGVLGGVIGSGLMVLHRASAVPVFAVSLAGYVVLYAGDITEGVFAALGTPQIAVLTTVVLIATALLFASRLLVRRGVLH